MGEGMTTLDAPYKRVERLEIAVVGGGIVGVSAAYAAAVRGHGKVRVSLYEASEVGHTGAASADLNRVFRFLSGPDSTLTVWSGEARDLWLALGRQWGSHVFHQTGLALLVEQGDGVETTGGHVNPYDSAAAWLEDALRCMDDYGAPYSRVSPAELVEQYPQFRAAALNEAVIDPQAGFLEASKALTATLELGLKAGVQYHPGVEVTSVESVGDGCRIAASDGREFRADSVVVAVNGWTEELLPQLKGALTLTEQPLIYLQPPDDSSALMPGMLPMYISLTSDCYGFPIVVGELKVADDNAFRTINHPDEREDPPREHLERVVSRVGNFLPSVAGATVERIHTCFYDRSKDGRFLLDALDSEGRIIYGCGMSGRAFKFGPVLGERLARFAVEGERPADIEEFRLR